MTRLERILDGLPEKITVTFFATFARFEFALMRCNYLRTTPRGNFAEPDWDKLADDLGEPFFTAVEVSGKAATLINDPPKRLIVQDHEATFGPRPEPVGNALGLFRAARRVRNNLFHGNKMFAADRDRDVALMSEVLWLLDYVMTEVPHLRATFDEPQR
jgi:hypothetical protein